MKIVVTANTGAAWRMIQLARRDHPWPSERWKMPMKGTFQALTRFPRR